jgi:hypothetical protein
VTTEMMAKRLLIWSIVALLAAFTALCTVFALIVTAVQAWQEHTQAQWPAVTAYVGNCGLQQGSAVKRQSYYRIRCHLNYSVNAEQLGTNVYSSSVPSREVWQYPRNQIAPLEQWVNDHPAGTPIEVRYDPGNHGKVVLVSTYLPPLGGPRTPSNLKLLAICAVSFLALLTIARFGRPPSA